MFKRLGKWWSRLQFRFNVGVYPEQISRLYAALVQRDDEQFVYVAPLDCYIKNTHIVFLDESAMSVDASYYDGSNPQIFTRLDSMGDWERVAEFPNWRRSFKPGDWQLALRELVRYYHV